MMWPRIFLVVLTVDWLSKSVKTHFSSAVLIGLVLRYAEKKFRRDGITIMTSHHVERVESVSSTEALRSIFIG